MINVRSKIERVLAFFFFCCAAFFIIYGIMIGEIKLGMVVFLPFLIGTGFSSVFAFLFLFFAIFLLFHSMSFPFRSNIKDFPLEMKEMKRSEKSLRSAGIIFIGPFPIIFGSNKKLTLILIAVAIIGILLFYMGWVYLF